jgi:hypothetical protein
MNTRILALLIMTARLKLIRYEIEASLRLGVPFFIPLPLLAAGAALALIGGAAAGALLAMS